MPRCSCSIFYEKDGCFVVFFLFVLLVFDLDLEHLLACVSMVSDGHPAQQGPRQDITLMEEKKQRMGRKP